jgi:RHS repeat-associated protein
VSYAYDLAGRLTSVSATAVPPTSPLVQYATTATYDALNRPTAISWDPAPAVAAPTAGSVTFGHSYNKANQRIGQTVSDNSWLNYPAAASPVSYTANALNRYTAVGAVSPTYDGNSNLTSDGTFTLGYDSENRLTTASGAGNTASYTYDAQGRRKTKTVNGTTTVFVTDADNREVLEYDATGAIQRWYAYGLGSNDVLNQTNVVAGTRTGFVPDIQGSVIASIDSSSGVLSKIGYLPYGKSAGAPGTFGYTAQRIDPEIGGLYYYRARHYSPAWGRFLQTDPIGYAGGSHLYAYVGNDPLNLIDPTGLTSDHPQGVWGSGTSAIIGLVDTTGAFTGAASLAARGGVLGPAAAITLPLALSGDTCQACNQDPFYYATYTRTNPTTDQVYSGRTSGYGDPDALVQARGLRQPILTGEGFSSPVLDKSVSVQQNPSAYDAIRGREQQLIDFNGGAQSMGGTSRNKINGIADLNPFRSTYIQKSIELFGALPDNSPRARGF